jgi:hypothetical protein
MNRLIEISVGGYTHGTLSVSEDCYEEIASALKASRRGDCVDDENKVIDMKGLGLLLDATVSSKGDC